MKRDTGRSQPSTSQGERLDRVLPSRPAPTLILGSSLPGHNELLLGEPPSLWTLLWSPGKLIQVLKPGAEGSSPESSRGTLQCWPLPAVPPSPPPSPKQSCGPKPKETRKWQLTSRTNDCASLKAFLFTSRAVSCPSGVTILAKQGCSDILCQGKLPR